MLVLMAYFELFLDILGILFVYEYLSSEITSSNLLISVFLESFYDTLSIFSLK
jgi:hypothetical protein